MRCLVLILLVCLVPAARAQEPGPAPKLLLDAGHCLATAQGDPLQLASRQAAQVELGYVVDSKSLTGADLLTVVNYTVPTHARGTVFTFLAHGKDTNRTLRLQYSVDFRQSDDGSQQIELVDPPLGGIGTQDAALSAIRQIGFRTYALPVSGLQAPSSSVQCESQPSAP
ncbi:MAG TPA: hypothetical protein VHZ09_18900 [Acidobacteriaceae bacterium]|nr:hypothetical protein [Acidobacteriaceae bacterium]